MTPKEIGRQARELKKQIKKNHHALQTGDGAPTSTKRDILPGNEQLRDVVLLQVEVYRLKKDVDGHEERLNSAITHLKHEKLETYQNQLATVIDGDTSCEDMETAIQDSKRMQGFPAVLDRVRDEHATEMARWNKMKEENAKKRNQATAAITKKGLAGSVNEEPDEDDEEDLVFVKEEIRIKDDDEETESRPRSQALAPSPSPAPEQAGLSRDQQGTVMQHFPYNGGAMATQSPSTREVFDLKAFEKSIVDGNVTKRDCQTVAKVLAFAGKENEIAREVLNEYFLELHPHMRVFQNMFQGPAIAPLRRENNGSGNKRGAEEEPNVDGRASSAEKRKRHQ